MIRTTVFALALVVGSALPALAQRTPLDSTAKTLIGTWEGTYESDHASPGSFRLVLAHDSVWKATTIASMQGQDIESVASDFKVSGNNLSWTQSLMGMSCKGSAVLAAGTLRGETTCDQGSIGYLLRKK